MPQINHNSDIQELRARIQLCAPKFKYVQKIGRFIEPILVQWSGTCQFTQNTTPKVVKTKSKTKSLA